MPILVNVKATQILPKIVSNWRAQQAFAVNDEYTKGLEYGKLVGVITGKCEDVDKAVFTYAGDVGATYTDIGDAPIAIGAVKPVGVIYDVSPRDQYGRTDDQTDNTRLFPMGARQDKLMPPMPEWVWEITDTDETLGNAAYFREIDKVLDTATSFDDATATIVFPGNVDDVRVGQKVDINGDFYYIEDISYDSGANETTFTLNEGAGDVVADVTLLSQLFEPVYLPDDMTGLPFTMMPHNTAGTGTRKQIGFVESVIAVRGKITH